MPITFERGRANVYNIAGFVGVLIVQTITATALWVNLSRDVQEVRDRQTDRGIVADKFNSEVREQLDEMPILNLRQERQGEIINDLRKSIDDTNKRFDKMVDLVSSKLDVLTSSLAEVRADVRVLTQEVRGQSASPKPTTYRK